jgi:type II secretory pathway pseudopilin PulG
MKSPSTKNAKGGFTLVEAVVAAALMSLLVAASYIAVSQSMYSARLMAQHVTAQGMCMALYEDMRAQAFDMIFSSSDEVSESSDAHYIETRRQFLMAEGLGPGASDLNISFTNEVSEKAETYIASLGASANIPPYKEITIVCTWVFKPPFASSSGQSGLHTEVLRGTIFDIQPRNSASNPLNINHMALNPHFADGTTYALPQYLRIVDENGIVYNKEDLRDGKVPSSLRAVSVAVTPGGGGEQRDVVVADGAKVKNDKRYSFFSNGANAASYISVQINQSGGQYFMNLYSSDATVCIQ